MSDGRRLIFPGSQAVELESFSLPEPGPGEVLVRTRFSLMSTGTENIVFNRLFDPGTHWDEWVKYPFHPGYASVGEVAAVGTGVDSLACGDRVTHRKGHCSHAVIPAAEAVRIPAEVSWEQAAWFALAKIGYHGALAAHHSLGDSVLVIGAGPIGQMSIRWARAAGVSFIAVSDLAESRLEAARRGGATLLLTGPLAEARGSLQGGNRGALPRVVVDSTGNAAVFSAALGLAADRGTVVLLGDTGRPGEQHLTKDLITRGLSVVGAHDNHVTATWNLRTITELFFDLVAQGRFSLEGLNSHVFRPEECGEAYAVANRDRSRTMGILFDWGS